MVQSQMWSEAVDHGGGQGRHPRGHADAAVGDLDEPGRGKHCQIERFADSPAPQTGQEQIQEIPDRPLPEGGGPEEPDILVPGRVPVLGGGDEFHRERPDAGDPPAGPVVHYRAIGDSLCHHEYDDMVLHWFSPLLRDRELSRAR